MVAQLPQDFYTFLHEVQNRLNKVIKSVGKIEHSLYPFLFLELKNNIRKRYWVQFCLEEASTHENLQTIFRPATHPDLIGISRFFSTNLGVSRFPENPEFLFRFGIGKTKGRLTLLHGPCLQTHKVWAKNKCCDRLNPLHTATQRVK